MKWRDTMRTGLSALRTHRLRSGLTVLGILIGIAAVILTVGLGLGAQQQVRSKINALGSNLLIVTPGSTTSASGIRGGFGSASTLTMADAQALSDKRVAPDIKGVAPSSSTSRTLQAGSTSWTASVVGSTPDWSSVRSRNVAYGRFLTDDDISRAASVVVLAPTTAQELFRLPVLALGQSVTINSMPFSVVGVLDPVSESSSSTEDDLAVVPITTASARLSGGMSRSSISTVYVEATSSHTMSAAYQETQGELLALHGITDSSSADFTITSQGSLIDTATSVDKTLTVLLAGIAAISLLVGGIGVMNIMLVSVTERVREIGLRKALGAKPRAIRQQFLVEACALGLVGGLLGVAVGLLGAKVLPHFIDNPIAISPSAAALAIAVAVVIGVAFGVYPATRAARLAPIDALRSE